MRTGAFGGAPIWGHETCEGCADIGAVVPCDRCRWGPRWSSLWGHETRDGVCRNLRGGALPALPLGPSVELRR
eukprot:6450058-Pyramimonas_sp.AAC.1